MKIFSNIREIFWPLLDPMVENKKEDIKIDEIIVKDSNVTTAFDLSLKYYESEIERKKSVESKSIIFIGTLTVVTAIIVGVAKLLDNINSNILSFLSIIILLLIVIYLCRAIWFAVKALERKAFYTINYKDILKDNDEKEYKKLLILQIINNTRKNSDVINEKVDNMTMTHEYFKRSIISIIIFSIIFTLNIINLKRPSHKYIIKKLINIFSKINMNTWNLFSIYALIAVEFIILLIILKKLKNISTNK